MKQMHGNCGNEKQGVVGRLWLWLSLSFIDLSPNNAADIWKHSLVVSSVVKGDAYGIGTCLLPVILFPLQLLIQEFHSKRVLGKEQTMF
jgi:hypothetical protein